MDVVFYIGALLLQVADFWLWFVIGLFLLIGAFVLIGRRKVVPRNFLRFLIVIFSSFVVILGTFALLLSGYQFWYSHRPLPSPVEQTVFEGVTYIREIRSQPRANVIHVVKIALDTPGLSFLVTPPEAEGDLPLKGQTVSQFLEKYDLQLAINGDFFEPWWSNGIWDYYPHVGDGVQVSGFASSRGEIYSRGRPNHPSLYISQDNQAQFDSPIGEIHNVISGNIIILKGGEVSLPEDAHDYLTALHPRTAIALDANAETLIIVVVDGRQPNYSEGVSLGELAEIVRQYGGYIGLNLDGGGSTTLVIESESGEPIVLNSPIDQRIPGRERPIASQLGIYAPPFIFAQ